MTERHRTSANWTSGLKGNYLPGLPRVELLDPAHLWLCAVVASQEELSRIVSRLLPGAVIDESQLIESFAEKWRTRGYCPGFRRGTAPALHRSSMPQKHRAVLSLYARLRSRPHRGLRQWHIETLEPASQFHMHSATR